MLIGLNSQEKATRHGFIEIAESLFLDNRPLELLDRMIGALLRNLRRKVEMVTCETQQIGRDCGEDERGLKGPEVKRR